MERKIGVPSLWPGHRSHHSSKGSVLFLTSWWAGKGEYMPNVRRDTPEGSWHHFTLNIRKDWRGCVGEGEGGGGGGREHPTPILLQTSGPCLWTRVGPVRRGTAVVAPLAFPEVVQRQVLYCLAYLHSGMTPTLGRCHRWGSPNTVLPETALPI